VKSTAAVSLLITLLFALLTLQNPAVIDEQLETLLVDYRFKIRNIISPSPAPENILIVAIDEKSLSKYGRWPWNRRLQSELINEVFEGRPKAVALDIFFPESETPLTDNALAAVLSRYKKRLVAALGFEVGEGKVFDGEIDDVLYDNTVMKIQNLKLLHAIEAFRVLLPPEPIAGASSFGHVYSLPDRDGKLRWENLYIKYGDEYFFSFSVRAAATALGLTLDQVSIAGGSGIDFGGKIIPSDEFGRLHLNYYGKEHSFTYLSAADLLSGNLSENLLKDKIVLIGTSAVATYDSKITPFSANMPGVEKNATVISNILNSDYLIKAPLYIDLFVVLLAGLGALLITRGRKASRSLIYYILLTLLVLVANQAIFTFYNTRVNLIYPMMTVLSIGIFVIGYRYFIEERKAREIRRMFSSYVTERVVNELIEHPELARLGGSRREVTVLFSDIAGFTNFSEQHDPEFVVEMLNEYLTAMTDIVFRWEGTLDKFIGDALVAFWGAPLAQSNHAELAVRCALNMIKKLEELQQKWISEGKTPLTIGIGLNTGEVIVGNIGAEGKKMDYTVIGDHVNIGARVESLTRKFKTNILMTELPLGKIRELVDSSRIGHVSINGVGNVVVKGRNTAIKIYEIKALDPSSESIISECLDDTVMHLKEK